MISPSDFIHPGNFVVGCNYWASHAGTFMWSDWCEDVVDEDLYQLSQSGLQVLRVFPLWPDFQPLKILRGGAGEPVEFRWGEEPLPKDEFGAAGVDPVMVDRFQVFTNLAGKHGLKIIVGLVTGWMSGRLFVPSAFDGLNVLSDPVALQWQVRLVRFLVQRFKNHPAILAWDLGNECNCMADLPNHQSAWIWTNAITSAIRLEDQSRPVVSGMHSLAPGRKAIWTMQDQAELTDLLTTHPYPYFTPHCDQDPANTIRTILHSTAESRFYADIGGKPCMAEEIGTLGPILASEAIAANFIRTCLFSLWAHNCQGLLWWCAFDQLHLEHAPYDWAACERELGLIRKDKTIKPVLKELGNFGTWLETLPIEHLPERIVDAVCILSEGQDQWGAAYSSFILAKQAGFDLEFQYSDQPLKPSRLYLMPSVKGMSSMSRRFWLELLEAVRQGASLYLSHDDCLLSPFTEPFGLEVQTRQRRSEKICFKVNDLDGVFNLESAVRLNIKPLQAAVFGWEEDGNPVFTCNNYGKGKMYFLSLPLERSLAESPGCFHLAGSPPYWKIYQRLANDNPAGRIVNKEHPMLGLTEHVQQDGERILVLINYSPERISSSLALSRDWYLKENWFGDITAVNGSVKLDLAGNDAAVFVVSRLSE